LKFSTKAPISILSGLRHDTYTGKCPARSADAEALLPDWDVTRCMFTPGWLCSLRPDYCGVGAVDGLRLGWRRSDLRSASNGSIFRPLATRARRSPIPIIGTISGIRWFGRRFCCLSDRGCSPDPSSSLNQAISRIKPLIIPAKSLRPSEPPCTTSIMRSGCGIIPRTLPASLSRPAILRAEPLTSSA
jgi:hypothetical protein